MKEPAFRRLSAWTLLQLRREILAGTYADEREQALWANAALLAKSLYRGEEPVYGCAEEVLRALGADEINDLIERYAAPERTEETTESGWNSAFDAACYKALTGGGT